MSEWVIRSIPLDDYLEESARVIRASFADVTSEFNLTEENCPASPAFETTARLRESRKRGWHLFGIFEGATQTGFVAVERARAGVYYLERLSVLPAYRHGGRGKALVFFVLDYVRSRGGKVVSLGAISENRRLVDWYESLGFVAKETASFEGLPFEVVFLEIAIDQPHIPGGVDDL